MSRLPGSAPPTHLGTVRSVPPTGPAPELTVAAAKRTAAQPERAVVYRLGRPRWHTLLVGTPAPANWRPGGSIFVSTVSSLNSCVDKSRLSSPPKRRPLRQK